MKKAHHLVLMIMLCGMLALTGCGKGEPKTLRIPGANKPMEQDNIQILHSNLIK